MNGAYAPPLRRCRTEGFHHSALARKLHFCKFSGFSLYALCECHRQLIDRLEKPERKLVLRIIDAQDQIAENLSTDSFIAGFQLAWRLASELYLREKERPTRVRKPRPDALFIPEERNDEEDGELRPLV